MLDCKDIGIDCKIAGMAFTDSPQESMFHLRRFTDRVYNDWYLGHHALPSLGKIGPKELPDDEKPAPVPKPLFKLGYIIEDDAQRSYLAFPDAVRDRFAGNAACCALWDRFLEEMV